VADQEGFLVAWICSIYVLILKALLHHFNSQAAPQVVVHVENYICQTTTGGRTLQGYYIKQLGVAVV
jgi:hypothetical protein